jgi:hypothetical protein
VAPVAAVVGFPGADEVPFIAAVREVPETPAEHDAMCWLVKVFADDRVQIGQTVGQMWAQSVTADADDVVFGDDGDVPPAD